MHKHLLLGLVVLSRIPTVSTISAVELLSVSYQEEVAGLFTDHPSKFDLWIDSRPTPNLLPPLPDGWTHLGTWDIHGDEIIRGVDASPNIGSQGFLYLSGIVFTTTLGEIPAKTLGLYGDLEGDAGGFVRIVSEMTEAGQVIVQTIDQPGTAEIIHIIPEFTPTWVGVFLILIRLRRHA